MIRVETYQSGPDYNQGLVVVPSMSTPCKIAYHTCNYLTIKNLVHVA